MMDQARPALILKSNMAGRLDLGDAAFSPTALVFCRADGKPALILHGDGRLEVTAHCTPDEALKHAMIAMRKAWGEAGAAPPAGGEKAREMVRTALLAVEAQLVNGSPAEQMASAGINQLAHSDRLVSMLAAALASPEPAGRP